MFMELSDRITVDSDMCFGKPVVRGKRYPVAVILELLAAGMTRTEILADYEDLQDEDISACLQYAAQALKGYRLIPLAA
jgi:uncharacterized protein (DUF433 family)